MTLGTMLRDVAGSAFHKAATRLYPLERAEAPAQYRGKLSFSPEACTGCSLCVKDCPSKAIELTILDRAAKRYVLTYHLDRCTFCGQCEVSCKFKCIELSHSDWEHAALRKEESRSTMADRMMSDSGWQARLKALLQKSRSEAGGSSRVALVGIGNELNGDDAAGVLIVRALKAREAATNSDQVLVIEGGRVPENVTGELRRFEPNIVLLIDAAEMGEEPGTIRWIEMEQIDGLSASTHSLPLSMLARYLSLEVGCFICLVGIQPASTQIGEKIGDAMRISVEIVTQVLYDSLF